MRFLCIPHCEIYIPHCGFCISQCETENCSLRFTEIHTDTDFLLRQSTDYYTAIESLHYFSVCSSGQFTKYNKSVARVNAVYNQRK